MGGGVGGGGVQTAAGVIQYICALHYGKGRGWEQRSEHAEIYGFGCRGAKIAISGAAGRLWGAQRKRKAGAADSGAARRSHEGGIRQPDEV